MMGGKHLDILVSLCEATLPFPLVSREVFLLLLLITSKLARNYHVSHGWFVFNRKTTRTM